MRAILVCPNSELRRQVSQSVCDCPDVVLSKSIDTYPSRDALNRMVRMWAPEVLFLSLEDPEAAEEICEHMETEFPGVQRIAVSNSQDPAILRLALRLRMREALIAPFEADFDRVMGDVGNHLERHPVNLGCSDRLFAFMPAKAGVGASVLAAGLTRAMATLPESRPLLVDFDSHSGVSGFLFNVDHEFNVSDAAKLSGRLDEDSWPRLVRSVDNIDLLLSGAPRLEEQTLNPAEIHHLLTFVRRNYTVISADLPDTLDTTTISVLREANRIFLVTSPELPSLRMARQKMALLRKLEMEDRVSLMVTRTAKRMDVSLNQIEEMVGAAITASFPSDYRAVMHSIREGKQPESLTPNFRACAETLLNCKFRKTKARFIEQFAVVPLRYGFR